MIWRTLAHFESLLPSPPFLRLGRSLIVNRDRLRRVETQSRARARASCCRAWTRRCPWAAPRRRVCARRWAATRKIAAKYCPAGPQVKTRLGPVATILAISEEIVWRSTGRASPQNPRDHSLCKAPPGAPLRAPPKPAPPPPPFLDPPPGEPHYPPPPATTPPNRPPRAPPPPPRPPHHLKLPTPALSLGASPAPQQPDHPPTPPLTLFPHPSHHSPPHPRPHPPSPTPLLRPPPHTTTTTPSLHHPPPPH